MFFKWLVLAFPIEDKITFAIANGGKRDPREGMRLKRQGVKKGVFDVFMSIPKKGYPGLYIEFKVSPNKPTKEQREFQQRVRNVGYLAEVCYDFDEAKELVEDYLSED